MALIKICPSCGYRNPQTEMMCQECAAFIADVVPTEESSDERISPNEPPEVPRDEPDSGATVRICGSVDFLDESGAVAFAARDGDIIGRRNVGARYLADKLTVSRRHCRVALGVDGWTLEDLDSANGTWINGVRIYAPSPIRDGDTVLLSQACELRVKL